MNVVIIGSGIAGITLAEEIRKLAPAQPVTLLTRETHGYYSRPMLSHGFSRDDVETKIILRPFDALRQHGIEVRDGVDVIAVDRQRRAVSFRCGSANEHLEYTRLVFATGSDALIPRPFQSQTALFCVLNSLDDLIALRRLRADVLAEHRIPHWAIIGGGLIGCELASDLTKSGDQVTLFHALPRLMERQLQQEDSAALAALLADSGVGLRLDSAVQGFERSGNGYAVRLETGEEGGFDGIVAACGFKPRVDLAREAGLSVGRGILVDNYLATADPAVFAIGDVAECADGRIYAYVLPIRSQALWLAKRLCGQSEGPWTPPLFRPKAKVHGFTAVHPYLF
ncbi:MAG: FAD-dependent oxidoreductase [Methylotetracoccus sp.]|nr:FAD-dependent oxidoreductase [Methylotetracoccus sp.]